MKIWFDILTPKQILFFEPMIKKLGKTHKVLCTSRQYREVTHIAKMRKIRLILVGKHGGTEKYSKLKVSLEREVMLSKLIKKYSPNLTISFCSPDAARISYGLGIKHIAFCDSPHAEAVMRLSIPLIDQLLIPWIIPKREFTKYGITQNKIISYKAIDASIIVKNKTKAFKKNLKLGKKKTLLIRSYESEAAYAPKKEHKMISIIQKISNEFTNHNVLLLARYSSQIKKLKNKLGKKIIVLDHVVDNNEIFSLTDVFIGSGGTMTAEAALRGIPTISYNAIPNIVENYLVKKGLVIREVNPNRMVSLIRKLLKTNNELMKKKARSELKTMEDPYFKLVKTIENITQ